MMAGMVGASAQDSAPLFKIGSVEVRPHATYSAVYDDNIFLDHKTSAAGAVGRNAGRDHDFIHTFTPGLRLNAGDAAQRQSAYFDANYEVAFTKFTDYTGSDATDHNASVEFGGKLNRLHVGVAQTLASRSDADVATSAANGRVKRKTWETKVDGDYEVSEKTSLSLNLLQTIGDYEAPLVDSVDRSATLWLDHQILPKVKAGLGGSVGYLQVDGDATSHNPNSSYVNGQGRLTWQATQKLSVNGSAGFEYRNIQQQGVSDPVSFIYRLSADWKAAERTLVSVGASRGTKVSNSQGAQLNEETSFTASLRHGLGDRVSVAVEAGYSQSHYDQTVVIAGASVRDDNYFFAKPSVSYRFMERANATLYYQYRRNDANLAANGNDFYNNQLGLELSYRF
ncbi:MAG: hypothetical protein RL514_87 [Verrucomicrobiota bacterium]